MKALLRRCIGALPFFSPLYKAAILYAARFSGENGFVFTANGEHRVLEEFAPHIRTAIDVGANVGDWTADVLTRNPRASIHCFEPARATFDQLSRRTFPPSVRLNHAGLSSQPGTAVLHTFGDNTLVSSLYRCDHFFSQGATATETIPLDTLDHYAATQKIELIDFLKIDVEGHEMNVLRGAQNFLSRGAIRVIQFEYNNTWSEGRFLLRDAFELLLPLGYRLYKITPNGCLALPEYFIGEENYVLKNYLALAPGISLPPALQL